MRTIMETRTFGESAVPADGPGTLDILLINEGWGSSGYYSQSTLQEAATSRVFPAGTHMFINHPSYSEAEDRPERDLNALAAVLQEDARWDDTLKGLRAKVTTFSNWRKPLAEMAEHIGVSIRGSADVQENGEAEGKRGRIITKLTEGFSVDFVTKAGRGGKVLNVIESAFSEAANGVEEALQGEVRRGLSAALQATYAPPGTKTYIYVRDWDDASKTVYFDEESESDTTTYAQGYALGADGSPVLVASRFQVRVQTSYVPVLPAGQSITHQESQEDTMPQIEESRLRALEEAERALVSAQEAAQTAAAERDAANERAVAAQEALRTSTNTATAERIVAEAFDGLEAPATRRNLLRNLVLTQEGALDEEQFRQIATESAAEFASLSGVGRVKNLGESAPAGEDISDTDLLESLQALSGNVKEG